MTPIWGIFHDPPSELYPYSVQFSEVGEKPAMIIRSSSTKRFPKPVVLKYRFWTTSDNLRNLPVPPGRRHAMLFLKYEPQLTLYIKNMRYMRSLMLQMKLSAMVAIHLIQGHPQFYERACFRLFHRAGYSAALA